MTKRSILATGFLMICIGLIGCRNYTMQSDSSFTDTISMTGEIFIPSESLMDPCLVNLIGNHLIIGNDKASPLIELYDLQTGIKEQAFLKIGNGPIEMLRLGYLQPDAEQNAIYVSDLFRRKMMRYDLDSVLADPLSHPTTLFERSTAKEAASPMLINKIGVLQDCMVAESRGPQGRILLMNPDGSQIGYFGTFPSKNLVDKNLNDIQNADLYGCAMTVKPSKDRVALAAYSGGMIDVYAVKDGKADSVWSYRSFYPNGIVSVPMGDNVLVAHTDESTTGFTSISSTDDYIYAVYSGKKKEDKTYPYGTEVYVLSWDGKETFRIMLDQMVNRLVAAPDNKTLYGISPQMDIIKFTTRK